MPGASPKTNCNWAQICAPLARAAFSGICPAKKATNSSPPKRPSTSLARNRPDKIRATWRMARSPARRPKVAFTREKSSKSMRNRAQLSASAMAASRFSTCRTTASRLSKPQSASFASGSLTVSSWAAASRPPASPGSCLLSMVSFCAIPAMFAPSAKVLPGQRVQIPRQCTRLSTGMNY